MSFAQLIARALILCCGLVLAACNPNSDPTSSDDTASPPAQAVETCTNCGTVASITPVTQQGQSSGAGAVVGAVVGGLLGNQVGSGSGRDAATAVGAVGGAIAGKEIEERSKSTTYYRVTVNMEGGGQQTVNVASAAGIAVGTPVKVIGNDLHVR